MFVAKPPAQVTAASSSSAPALAHGDIADASFENRCGALSDTHSDELARLEEELTKSVPALLEAMNRTSDEVNTSEKQVEEAKERYQRGLEQWSRLYEDLRAQYGSAIDRVRPYVDAAQALNNALHRVQGAVREFSAASSQHARAKGELRDIEEQMAYGAHKVQLDRRSQDKLASATVRVLTCQQERDRLEQEYAHVLREYQEAQESVDAWRSQIGESTIKRTLPCFRQLQQHQHALAAEQQRISTYTERRETAKNAYARTLRELDRISACVHAARQEYKERHGPTSSDVGTCSAEDSPPPEITGRENTPPSTPERATLDKDDKALERERVIKLAAKLGAEHCPEVWGSDNACLDGCPDDDDDDAVVPEVARSVRTYT